MLKQTSIIILLSIGLISACTESVKPTNTVKQTSSIDKLENFVPTKLQIASGLLEGIAALPYLLNIPIITINKALIEVQAEISLDKTYQIVYGKTFKEVPPVSGNTGIKYKGIKQTNKFLKKLLNEEYSFTALESDQYILISLINKSKEVIDWAALPKKYLQTQKAQAILITLAANSVLNEKTMPKYKEIETRWVKSAREIVEQRFDEINQRMGV
ncbi:hypothetical protein [Candidatus Marithrix sp. Canyon 246]|uniref:hypothetical protein n=1 Tax=Candidatus Marithrix sp. Canyon 246 TaxID=1827136 RepID=UPI00084A21CF|nr:hypothetical protein [Candidatus Marithrix sp. Canyon 246]